ncbi:MAG: N-acetyltransferase family protein [Spirochaetota bacterium]
MVLIRNARTRDVSDIARIHIDMWRVAYADLLAPEFLRELSYARSRLQWEAMLERHSGVLLVAESNEDGIVGFAAGGAERTRAFEVDGELTALYVLAGHHRRGIGKALVHRMAKELHANGRNGMVVWVLSTNPARGFYEHLGGERAGEQRLHVGGESVRETAYLWKDLEELAER